MGAQRIDGVDISHYQNGTLDWAKAKRAGLKFLYHKATEGSTLKDGNYSKRRVEAARNGVPFGAYHFARPSGNDALLEAKFFLSVARPRPGDMRPMLDLEVTGGLDRKALTQWVRVFVAEVRRVTGQAPFIYTPFDLNRNFGCPLWVARYSDSNREPRIPAPWKTYTIWQFSNGVYGTPDRVPGFGAVDINTVNMRPAAFLRTFRLPSAIPKPKPEPAGDVARLRFAHLSMQFKDTDRQHTHDINKVFARGYDVITGTEAGPGAGNTREELLRLGQTYGYRVHAFGRYDTWVAVKESLIVSGWQTGQDAVFKSPLRGLVWAQWSMGDTYGQFSVAAVHNHTWRKAGDDKTAFDTTYAEAMGGWGRAHAKGLHLAFIGGDFNRNDRRHDVFFDQPFTTCWDELETWPKTHRVGPIDAIASYDHDARVRCISARVLTDNEFHLFTDHSLVEAVYEIRPIRSKATPAPAPVRTVSAFRRRAIERFRKQGKGAEWMCLKRVREAYGIAAKYPSAISAWLNTPAAHKHQTRNAASIPRGYPIFFEGGKYGHVAISLGNGYCLSTDISRLGYVDRVKITAIEKRWGHRLVGWTDRLNGVDIP